MTPEQLVQATGFFYQNLIHPALDDPMFLADLDRFCQLRDNLDQGLALQLIQEVNWRDRLLGFAVAALRRDWSLSADILETLQRPTSMAIVPAGAFSVSAEETGPNYGQSLQVQLDLYESLCSFA